MVDRRDDHLGVPLGKPLEEVAVQEFAANFQGELVRPEDDHYDTVRAVFNGMIDRRPALIARCTGVVDVAAAVTSRARTSWWWLLGVEGTPCPATGRATGVSSSTSLR